jgi:hypothetical protein
MEDKKCEVPSSATDDKKNQSISSADQKGNVISAQPTVDGPSSGTGRWVGNGPSLKFIESK